MPSRPCVLLLCGPSFSGKSTLAAAIARQLELPVISLDEINARRGLSSGFMIAAEEWNRAHAIGLAELEELMRNGAPGVIVDDTNCFRHLRDDFRAVAGRLGADTVVITMRVSEDELRKRMRHAAEEARARGADQDRFTRHLLEFEWPDDDEQAIDFAGDVDRWIATELEPILRR